MITSHRKLSSRNLCNDEKCLACRSSMLTTYSTIIQGIKTKRKENYFKNRILWKVRIHSALIVTNRENRRAQNLRLGIQNPTDLPVSLLRSNKQNIPFVEPGHFLQVFVRYTRTGRKSMNGSIVKRDDRRDSGPLPTGRTVYSGRISGWISVESESAQVYRHPSAANVSAYRILASKRDAIEQAPRTRWTCSNKYTTRAQASSSLGQDNFHPFIVV